MTGTPIEEFLSLATAQSHIADAELAAQYRRFEAASAPDRCRCGALMERRRGVLECGRCGERMYDDPERVGSD